MFRPGFFVLLVVGVLAGCRYHNFVLTDPDGNAAVTHTVNVSLQRVVWWVVPAVMLILAVAALLHWRRTRHWCLAVLALSAFLMTLGLIAGRLGEWPMRGATIEEIASGRRAPIQWLMSLGQWFAALGFVLSGIGGIGAILLAARRKTETPTENL